MPAVKREHTDSEPELDSAPPSEPSTPPKRAKGKGSRPKSSPTKSSPGSLPEGQKKMGSWSGEELKLLYTIMCPKRTGINWADVASQIPGRDVKSCTNKWSRMQGKIQQAIESMGE